MSAKPKAKIKDTKEFTKELSKETQTKELVKEPVKERVAKDKGYIKETVIEEPTAKKGSSVVASFFSFLGRKTPKSEKFKGLPDKALQEYTNSGLDESEVLENWDIFIICLHCATPKGTFNDTDKFQLPRWVAPKRIRGSKSEPTLPSSISVSEKTMLSNSKSEVIAVKSSLPTQEEIEAELKEAITYDNPRTIFSKPNEIGRGSYGTVYTAYEKANKRLVALKYLDLNWDIAEEKKKIVNEVYVMTQCKHENIVNFLGAYLHNQKMWIAMEYCDGGTLEELLSIPLKEELMSFVLRQIVAGLAYLHSQQRVHRDIKSSNVLLNMDGAVKIADMGLSVPGGGLLKGFAGSKYWMAPEIIRREKYTERVDIWSLGAVGFEMAQGEPPYNQYTALKAMFYTATRGAEKLRKPDKHSKDFLNFLDLCFQRDQELRPSAAELSTHPFLKLQCKKDEVEEALRIVFLMRVTSGF